MKKGGISMNNSQSPKLKAVAKRKRQPARNRKISALVARKSYRSRIRRMNHHKNHEQKGA